MSKTPEEKRKKAKSLLESGLISQEKYDLIQEQCLIEMGLVSTSSPKPVPKKNISTSSNVGFRILQPE